MVQLSTSALVLFVLVAPSIAAPFEIQQAEGIESRDTSNALERRFHFPKFHIPKKAILSDLIKYGPKVGRTGLKLANAFMHADAEGSSLAGRDETTVDDLQEIMARSRMSMLLKAAKTAGKYAKKSKKYSKYAKTASKYAKKSKKYSKYAETFDDFFGRSVDPREIDLEDDVVAREVADPEINARDLQDIMARSRMSMLLKAAKTASKYAKKSKKYSKYAETFDDFFGRSVDPREIDLEDDVVAREVVNPEIDTRDVYEPEIYERDMEGDLEMYEREPEVGWETYFGRDYNDFGMEELD